MWRVALLILVAAVTAGCNGRSTSATSTEQPQPTQSASHIPHRYAKPLPKTVCAAFKGFYADLSSTPPMGHQIQLVASVEIVGKVADTNPEAVSRHVFNDVQNLVAYVGSMSFPNEGSIEGTPVQRMVSDCF